MMIRRRLLSAVALAALLTGVAPVPPTAAAAPAPAAPIAEASNAPAPAAGAPTLPARNATAPSASREAPAALPGGQQLTLGGPDVAGSKGKNPKADWRIDRLISESVTLGPKAAQARAAAQGIAVEPTGVRVIVEASGSGAATAVRQTGASVERQAGALLQVLATPAQLAAIVADPDVRYVRPPARPVAYEVTDQAVAATNASTWQARGRTGAGVKVAVIDLGFAGYTSAQASGDLPASLTTVDDCSGSFGTSEKHGTAVAEIVHKMAPDAQLYLICIATELDLQAAEQYAVANGIAIVNHSVGWYDTSRGDGSGGPGSPDAVVADARSHGILWVNAAGNDALSHWSGNFVDNGQRWNLFAPGNAGNAFTVAANEYTCVLLKWDAWPATNQDFDLYVVLASDQRYYFQSTNDQTGTQAPVEEVCFTNGSASQTWLVMIGNYNATTAPRFDLYVLNAPLQYAVAAGSVAEPASSPSAFAVGAVCWQATTIEPFSSRGPTIDGRIKPDMSGPDQVSTYTYGASGACSPYSGFAGTSAAAPHVAGAAALVKSANPGFTAAQLQAYLQSNAHDLGPAGRDGTYGYGELALPTVAFAPTAPSGVAAAAGDGDATVSWAAANDGGSPIARYTVTASPGGRSCTSTGLSCTVFLLANGVSYTFTVTATNGVGSGPASGPSNAVTPAAAAGVPSAPPTVTASRGDRFADVTWTAAADGGSPISQYTVTAEPGPATCVVSALSCRVGGLVNGMSYTFRVRATNANGTGIASGPSNAVVPAGLPGAPVITRAIGRDRTVDVTWSAANANGDPITNYTVRISGGAVVCSTASLSCSATGLTNRTAYTFTVAATNGIGSGPASAPSGSVTPLAGSTYVPLTPNRIVDSRPAARLGLASPLANGAPASFVVVNRAPSDAGQNVPANATAVTGNLTVTGQTSKGYFSLTPSKPVGIPSTSTLNFPLGDTRADAVTVPLGSGGVLWVTFVGESGAVAHVVFDVTGYFVPDATGATYVSVTPNRLVDSRPAAKLGLSVPLASGVPASFIVVNRVPTDSNLNIPSNATAVTGNLTATGQTSKGYFSLTPSKPVGIPSTSTLNFPLGDTRANAVTVRLGAGGMLWVTFSGTSGATANVVFDVTGYFLAGPTGATYVPLTPNRLVDSRAAARIGLSGPLANLVPAQFTVVNRVSADATRNVPAGALAVTGNLTVTEQTSKGYLSLTPSKPVGIPSTSTLNFPLGDNRANAVAVPLGLPGGVLSVTFVGAAGAKTNVVFDVTGYFRM